MDMKEKMPSTPVTPMSAPSLVAGFPPEAGSSRSAEDEPMAKEIEILTSEDEGNAPGADASSQATVDDTLAEDINSSRQPKMCAHGVGVFYGEKRAISDVSIKIYEDLVTAFIGPSGCGKSTFLRCLNRMNDTIPSARVTGRIDLDNEDITSPDMDVVQLRARVGMVFQKPNPFPKSIFENVAYGPRIHGLSRSKS